MRRIPSLGSTGLVVLVALTAACSPLPGLTPRGESTVDIGPSTGTVVSERTDALAAEHRALELEIAALDARLAQAMAEAEAATGSFLDSAAEIRGRVASGTRPGNPELVARIPVARAALGRLQGAVAELESLYGDARARQATAGYLLRSTAAIDDLSGGVDADTTRIERLGDMIGTSGRTLDRMAEAITEQMVRRRQLADRFGEELRALTVAVAEGELAEAGPPPTAPYPVAAPSRSGGRRSAPGEIASLPFDEAGAPILSSPVRSAVATALSADRASRIRIVPVASARGGTAAAEAARSAARRLRTLLVASGLPSSRINIGAVQTAMLEAGALVIEQR